MKAIHKWIVAALCTLPMWAAAQWQWLDKDGRKVYSDRPPPSDVPAKNILRNPGGGTLSSFGPEGAASAPAPASSAPNGKDGGPDAAKSAALTALLAEEEKRRADACRRARDSLVVLRSGVRLKAPNAKGEIDIVSDAERASEIDRLQAIVASQCK